VLRGRGLLAGQRVLAGVDAHLPHAGPNTIGQAAERLGTTERFPRRLIAERRITVVKLGTHVRIPEAALEDFIAASTVEAAE